nr:MAG TPA: hypothetical protein [Caudoviricetes sp.]
MLIFKKKHPNTSAKGESILLNDDLLRNEHIWF